MPKYHFVWSYPRNLRRKNEMPKDRIFVKYKSKGFSSADHIRGGKSCFYFSDCRGSLLLIDRGDFYLNKLHIGDQVLGNPHVESSIVGGQEEGPRLDLSRFDIKYAVDRLRFLQRIRNPRLKQAEIMSYLDFNMYAVPHRLRELSMSDSMLNHVRGRQEDIMGSIKDRSDNLFVSERSTEIERTYRTLKHLMDAEVEGVRDIESRRKHSDRAFGKGLPVRRSKKRPNFIASPTTMELVRHMRNLTQEVLGFVHEHPNFDENLADAYWKDVRAYAQMIGGFEFIKYSPDFIGHVERHSLLDRTVGSKFFSSRGPIEIIDLAFRLLESAGYEGRKTTVQESLGRAIGFESVVPLSELPSGIKIVREKRDDEHEVNVVGGGQVRPRPTNLLSIVVGPLNKKEYGENMHGFLSIYPGRYCPDISEDPEFWENHAFVM